jgi:hypothetical protein
MEDYMLMQEKGLGGWGWVVRVLPAVLALTVVAGTAAAQSSGQNRKMKREITVMENILDQVVIDSRNVLVPSRHSVHGAYLPEFGVMFTTEASLLFRDWDNGSWSWGNVERKGDRIIIHRNTWDDDDDDEDDDSGSKRSTDRRTWEARRTERAEKLYKGAREELTDALMEFGDTISSLRDDEWVGITVYLGNDDYFHDRNISRLVIKAKAGDLQDFTAGRLSKSAMQARLVEDEY